MILLEGIIHFDGGTGMLYFEFVLQLLNIWSFDQIDIPEQFQNGQSYSKSNL